MRIMFKRHLKYLLSQGQYAWLCISAELIDLTDLMMFLMNTLQNGLLFVSIDAALFCWRAGKEFLDLVQRKIQLLELLNQRKGFELVLAICVQELLGLP